jgi:huntingtin interacting protein 1
MLPFLTPNPTPEIATEIKDCGNISATFFKLLATNADTSTVDASMQQLKDKLYAITNMIGDLSSNRDEIERLEDMVEAELNGMDKAIEEASARIMEMLAQSRASDTGIKLEVNEKILDSCTGLMQCIKVLVQKSRKVQGEIIATGKGSASAKEFYKRNHQWTEGLISAAGSVAAAAKLLV